jgi:hypothetical protein
MNTLIFLIVLANTCAIMGVVGYLVGRRPC